MTNLITQNACSFDFREIAFSHNFVQFFHHFWVICAGSDAKNDRTEVGYQLNAFLNVIIEFGQSNLNGWLMMGTGKQTEQKGTELASLNICK
jgi:hypothetical protein